MITIFSLPKPFLDSHISIIQRNAISSWLKNGLKTLIIGDEEKIEEETKKLGAKHIGTIRKSDFGTPLLNDAFRIAQMESVDGEIMIYSNADIIFPDDLKQLVEKLSKGKFLAVGRRIDLDVTKEIDFNNKNEVTVLKNLATQKGNLHSHAGIDYFIFRKNMLFDLPPLVVGRIGWDNFMIWNAKQNKIPVIDMTNEIVAIHQNHKPAPQNSALRKTNPEALHNISFIKGRGNACTIEDATHKMVNGKIIKNYLHWLPKIKRFIKSFY